MKIIKICSVVLLTALSVTAFAKEKKKKVAPVAEVKVEKIQLANELDSVSYALGISFATNIKAVLSGLNTQVLAKVMDKVFAGDSIYFSMEEANQIITSYVNKLKEKESEGVIKAGKSFLEQNKLQNGVVVLPSGLQYKIIKQGEGEKPTRENQVKVHYEGRLTDGKVFDSSIERGEPATFGVGQVIPGWTEALQLMPVGSKWQLYIPSELAYGAQGAGGVIGPYSVLVFDVELLEIVKE